MEFYQKIHMYVRCKCHNVPLRTLHTFTVLGYNITILGLYVDIV